MKIILFLVFIVLAILAFRGMRWAYVSYVVLGLLYFPFSVGFRLDPHPCELALSLPLAIHSLGNYAHIVLLTFFFLMTRAQWTSRGQVFDLRAFGWAALATIVMGALVEAAEGISGKGHCRLRDLVPDTTGALIGAALAWLWQGIRIKLRPKNI